MAVVTSLDFDKRVQEQFPNIEITEVNGTTPLVVQILEKGDMPIIGSLNGVRKVIARASISAYNIDKLIRTHSEVIMNKSGTEKIILKSVTDYLEAI